MATYISKSLHMKYENMVIVRTQFIPGGIITVHEYNNGTVKQAITNLYGVSYMFFDVPVLISSDGELSFDAPKDSDFIPARTIIKSSVDGIEIVGEDTNFQF